ncbi:MAG: ABC transporter permease [Deltaproteobacteria bacterium]|nr:MAG: ABC transporter permease [Deltaproteobacteria bacterium]
MTRAPGRFWSNVKAVAYKETRILRHDRAFIGVIVAQPIMMLILQGAVLSNKPANVPWAVLDWSRSAVARRFVADVEATGYFLPPQSVASYDEGRRLLQQAEALAFVVIPETLARDVERGQPRVQLLLDGSDPLSAARVGGYIAQVGAALDLGTDTSQERRPEVPVRLAGPVDIRQRFWFNPTLADRRFFLSALAGMLLTNLCLSVMSLGLVGERESGTYEQMLALPTSSLEIVIGKVAPYVAVSYALMLVSTAAAGVIFGVWPRGSWVTLSVATLPFVLASLAIGVFVSALARTSAQAVFIAVFFILPSFVLSGVIYPYQFMPRGVREIGGLFPLRWYQIALRRIIERGAGLVDVAGPMLALTLLFAVLLLAIRWRMKPRLG